MRRNHSETRVMNIGEKFTLKIEKMISGGKGLSHLKDKIVFVPYVLPEEEIEIEIARVKKDYLVAKKTKVLSPSLHRKTPPCPVFEVCGGCQFQMMDYPFQLQTKSAFLQESLNRIGKIDPPVLPPVPSPKPFHYRNRVKFQVSWIQERLLIGFYQSDSREIVPVSGCDLLNPVLNSLLEKVSSVLNQNPEPFLSLQEMSLSLSPSNQDILMELRMEAVSVEKQAVENLWVPSFNIRGIVVSLRNRRQITFGNKETVQTVRSPDPTGKPVKIRTTAGVFSQVNSEINIEMIRTLLSWIQLSGKERVLELYSGNGNFTLFLAPNAFHLTAVERNPLAIEDLYYNLQSNGIKNCSVRREKTETVLTRWDRIKFPLDVVVLDPPREGLDPRSLGALLKIRPASIYYVSCDPATLARDLKALSTRYEIRRVLPFDMFPQTAHLESLAELVRR